MKIAPIVVVLVALCCAAGVQSQTLCSFPQIDWNLQGNPQPCSCNAKVFLLAQNSITVAFKTRVFATKVKLFFAPLDVVASTTTPSTTSSTTPSTTSSTTPSTTPSTTSSTTPSTTPSTTSSTTPTTTPFTGGTTAAKRSSLTETAVFSNGLLKVKLIGSNGQSVVVFDSSDVNGPIFDGGSDDCFSLTITPPALPYRVQKVELSSTDAKGLFVRGVKLFGFTDSPAPSTQQPGYVAAPDGVLPR